LWVGIYADKKQISVEVDLREQGKYHEQAQTIVLISGIALQ
jgi:hypothetical protein